MPTVENSSHPSVTLTTGYRPVLDLLARSVTDGGEVSSVPVRVVRPVPGRHEPGPASISVTLPPAVGVLSAVMIRQVPAIVVTSPPPGRSAASQAAGTGRWTATVETIRS